MIRLLLFVGVPLVEMALLIWVGGRIGVGATLGVILLTGIVGASLVKRQGLSVWYSAQERLAMGAVPADEMVHGAMLLVAGAFLLTPGFLTDVVGFSLLMPAVREWLRGRFGARMSERFGTAKRVEVWRV